MTKKVPLIGRRLKSDHGRGGKRGLIIRSSDIEGQPVPPSHVREKHEEIQKKVDKRKVIDGKEHGCIEYTDEEVTNCSLDDELVKS